MTDKRKLRVYVSGPISGLTVEVARRRFDNAKALLTKSGYDVVTPFDNGLPADAPYPDHMKADIRLLLDCDAIFMLPDWDRSPGACAEHKVAEACGLSIYTAAGLFDWLGELCDEIIERLCAERECVQTDRHCGGAGV